VAAFVLGNGESRAQVSVPVLMDLAPVYGCNAIYREHTVTVLVATDAPIASRIQESGYARTNRFYTRRPRADQGAMPVPQKYHGFSSGPIAAALAAMDHCTPIYLIGFDMGPNSVGCFNNIYAGTEFYKSSGSRPTYTGNWQKQLKQITADFRHQYFVRVMGTTSAEISEFQGIKNLSHITMQQFQERINKREGI
jgi:hypothetical protein